MRNFDFSTSVLLTFKTVLNFFQILGHSLQGNVNIVEQVFELVVMLDVFWLESISKLRHECLPTHTIPFNELQTMAHSAFASTDVIQIFIEVKVGEQATLETACCFHQPIFRALEYVLTE